MISQNIRLKGFICALPFSLLLSGGIYFIISSAQNLENEAIAIWGGGLAFLMIQLIGIARPFVFIKTIKMLAPLFVVGHIVAALFAIFSSL